MEAGPCACLSWARKTKRQCIRSHLSSQSAVHETLCNQTWTRRIRQPEIVIGVLSLVIRDLGVWLLFLAGPWDPLSEVMGPVGGEIPVYLPTCFIYVILPPYLLTTSYIFTHGIGLSNPQPTHAPTTRLRPRQAAKGRRGSAVGGLGGVGEGNAILARARAPSSHHMHVWAWLTCWAG